MLKFVSVFFLALIFVLSFIVSCTAAQKRSPNKMKTAWSPPDNSFTVVVPAELEEIKGEYADESSERFKSITLFGSAESDASLGAFEVAILQLSENERLNIERNLDGLEFLIGGDDQKPTKVTFVKVDGLSAKEVVFISRHKCSKGLIIDAGDRIYVLGLAVDVCEKLNSKVAKRFFETFHIVRRG